MLLRQLARNKSAKRSCWPIERAARNPKIGRSILKVAKGRNINLNLSGKLVDLQDEINLLHRSNRTEASYDDTTKK